MPESKRHKRIAEWKAFYGNKIAEVHQSERLLASLTEEPEAAISDLERIKAQTRQKEKKMDQLKAKKVEREEEEQHEEEEQRAYVEITRS